MTYAKVAAISITIFLCACGADLQRAAQTINPTPSATAAEQPELTVYKNANCGCCKVWIEHMRKNGFAAKVNDVHNMNPIKERVGVPYGMGSCHTAQVGGYFIEGHVPAEVVARLLKEKPKAKGVTVPGMPIGSPGMEQGNTIQPYEVHLVHPDGTTSVYAKYPK